MSFTGFTPPPADGPPLARDPANFDARADPWYDWWSDPFFGELNDFLTYLTGYGASLGAPTVATSTSSNTISADDKTFTVATNLGFLPGYPVIASYTTDPTKNMIGFVKTYTPGTGQLVITVTTTNGSGSSLTAWSIGVIPPASKAAGSDIWAGTDDLKWITSKAFIDAAAYQTLTDASTVSWDASLGFNAKVTLTAARTIGKPTNLKPNIPYKLKFDCGGFTPAWNAAWNFGAQGVPTPDTTSGKKHFVIADYDVDLDQLIASYWAPA